jgi:hypothetical protein
MSNKISRYIGPIGEHEFGIGQENAYSVGSSTEQGFHVYAQTLQTGAGGIGEARFSAYAISDEGASINTVLLLLKGINGTNRIETASGTDLQIQNGTSGAFLFLTAGVASLSCSSTVTLQGANAAIFCSGNQRVTVNNTSPYAYKTAGGAWGTISDDRLKKNSRPINDAIGKLNSLNPCHFEFKNAGENANPEGTRTGFIAQEFEQVLPGHTFEIDPAFDADKAILGEGVKAKGLEADLVPYLVKAIQEMSAKIASLETQLAALQSG